MLALDRLISLLALGLMMLGRGEVGLGALGLLSLVPGALGLLSLVSGTLGLPARAQKTADECTVWRAANTQWSKDLSAT